MSLIVVVAVSVLVFLYVRTSRRARQAWLEKLDLPGRWRCGQDTPDGTGADDGAVELLLQGKADSGAFVLQEGQTAWRGEWRLVGHVLHLTGAGREQHLDLHYFKPGSIGLENEEGVRRLYNKATTNVVPLRATKNSDH